MKGVDQANRDREELLAKAKQVEVEFATIFERHADHEKIHTAAVLAIAIRAGLTHLKKHQKFASTMGGAVELAEAITAGQMEEHSEILSKER